MRLAAIDIGSNSTRLLVAEHRSDGWVEVDRLTTVTGLGRGLAATDEFSQEGIAPTLATLARYTEKSGRLGASRMVAVATAAARRARNREWFLDRAAEVLGVRPRIISGREEARLAFAGATSGLEDPGSVLVVDIGGGSTEFVTADTAHSVDIGSVRLTDLSLPDRPASPQQLHQAARIAAAALAGLPVPDQVDLVVGVAGSWTSLSAIIWDLPAYDRARVHHSTVTRRRLEQIATTLAGLTLDETEAIPSLDPARAPAILGGALVAEQCLGRIGADRVLVSELDLLDGLTAQTLGGPSACG